MAAMLKAADVRRQELLEVLPQLRIPAEEAGSARIWLEAPDGWSLDRWQRPDGRLLWYSAGQAPKDHLADACLSRSQAGRIFSSSGELRWRRLASAGDGLYRIVFLGDCDWLPDGWSDHSQVLDRLIRRVERQFLWGQQTEHSPGEWIELRIPHRFRYPISAACRAVQAEVEIWEDDAGQPQFVRLCALVPFQETSHASE
jgi:hypothetical protein